MSKFQSGAPETIQTDALHILVGSFYGSFTAENLVFHS